MKENQIEDSSKILASRGKIRAFCSFLSDSTGGSTKRKKSMRKLKSPRNSQRLNSPTNSFDLVPSVESEEEHEPKENVTAKLLQIANKITGQASTDVLTNAVWILRFVRDSLPKIQKKNEKLKKKIELRERHDMEKHDIAITSYIPHMKSTAAFLTPAQSRSLRERQAKLDWRHDLITDIVNSIEEHIVRDCPPAETAFGKYWEIVSRRKTDDEQQCSVAMNSILSATLGIIGIVSVKVTTSNIRIRIFKSSREATIAAAVATITVSGPLYKPRRRLDFIDNSENEFEFLPLSAAEEISFRDDVSSKIILILPPRCNTPSIGYIQTVIDGVLYPPTSKVHLQFTDLVLKMKAVPTTINLPWANIRKILGFIRLLCDRFRVDNNFAEQMPPEGSAAIPPRPRYGSCYFPGDPLGGAKSYELEYSDFKRKSTHWSEAERSFRRRSTHSGVCEEDLPKQQNDSSDVEEANVFDDGDDVSHLNNRRPSSRVESFVKDTSFPDSNQGSFMLGSLISPTSKRRRKKSLFRELSNSPEAMILKSAWGAMIDGLRELCSGLRRATQNGSSTSFTSNYTDSLFLSLRSMSTKVSHSCSELDIAKRLTTELVEVIKALFTKREKQQQQNPNPVHEQHKDEGSKVKKLEDQIEKLQLDCRQSKKENDKLERQMLEAVSILKADREAVLEGEQLRQAITEVEMMSEAVATMKFEVLDWLSTLEKPTPIQKSLSVIAWMLHEYQRFLPTAILSDNDIEVEEDDLCSHATPSRKPPIGIITIVYTDIQSSTSLWEAAPLLMQKSLNTHNTVLRRLIKQTNGYEVRTIGDAFVIAFDSALEACQFGLSLQEALVKADWDEELLECADCCREDFDGKTIWRGLRVRVGIHTGSVDMKTNPISGKADYIGPVMNIASKIESSSTGGLVAITNEVMSDIKDVMIKLRSPIIIPYGSIQLKGITEGIIISGLVPFSLSGRCKEVAPQEGVKAAPTGKICMLFTDIQSSTMLWDQASEMNIALATHNTIMRNNLNKHNGYEVKTIGDAFMVAFNSCFEAVNFSLNVQLDLVHSDWPSSVTAVPSASTQIDIDTKNYLWNGIRVRIGIHCGHADAEKNPLTGRYDYFGTTVNKSSRIESASAGGIILITKQVLSEISESDLIQLDNPVLIPYGIIKLKGVAEGADVYGILPKSLSNRQHDCVIAANTAEMNSRKIVLSSAKQLRTGLKSSIATVAYVRLMLPYNLPLGMMTALSAILSNVEFSAERTDGVISVVCNDYVLVTWNAGKKCKSHSTQAIRFTNLLYYKMRCSSFRVNIGIASGNVLYGVTASDKKRFTTTVGACIGIASELAISSHDEGTFCFVCDEFVPFLNGSVVNNLSVGQRVQVKDNTDFTWTSGTVAEIDSETGPLVTPDSGGKPSNFDHVRLHNNDNNEFIPVVSPRNRGKQSVVSLKRNHHHPRTERRSSSVIPQGVDTSETDIRNVSPSTTPRRRASRRESNFGNFRNSRCEIRTSSLPGSPGRRATLGSPTSMRVPESLPQISDNRDLIEARLRIENLEAQLSAASPSPLTSPTMETMLSEFSFGVSGLESAITIAPPTPRRVSDEEETITLMESVGTSAVETELTISNKIEKSVVCIGTCTSCDSLFSSCESTTTSLEELNSPVGGYVRGYDPDYNIVSPIAKSWVTWPTRESTKKDEKNQKQITDINSNQELTKRQPLVNVESNQCYQPSIYDYQRACGLHQPTNVKIQRYLRRVGVQRTPFLETSVGSLSLFKRRIKTAARPQSAPAMSRPDEVSIT